MTPPPETFGEELRRARAEAGMSRAAVCRDLLIPYRTLEQWEAGYRMPPRYVVQMLLRYYADQEQPSK